MTLSQRDRRALLILAVALAVMAAFYFWPQPEVEVVGGTTSDVRAAAARLDRIRQEAAQMSLRVQMLNRSQTALAELERGLIAADSQAQAQAQLLQIFRRVARGQSPPLEARTSDFGAVRPYGDGYAQVLMAVTMECQIDQLVNLLADISAQTELLALEDLRIAAANAKEKTISVRMTIAGLTRAALARPRGA